MKLKNQRPGPKGAVEPVKKKIYDLEQQHSNEKEEKLLICIRLNNFIA
jgi:hypothetical protein